MLISKYKFIICASEKKREENQKFINELSSLTECSTFEVNNSSVEKKVILLMGGDGSLYYLLNKLSSDQLRHDPSIIYFPQGTANDFAKSLKVDPLKPNISKINSILMRNQKISIPVMSCNGKRFINVASVGVPADITSSGDNDLLKKLAGQFSYYINGLSKIFNTTSYSITYHFDGKSYKLRGPGFIISQGLFAGGGIKVSTSYTPNFGEYFNFMAIRSEGLSETVSSIVEIQKETPNLETPQLISELSTKILIESDTEIPAKLDGEEYKEKKFKFQKEPFSLNFYLQ